MVILRSTVFTERYGAVRRGAAISSYPAVFSTLFQRGSFYVAPRWTESMFHWPLLLLVALLLFVPTQVRATGSVLMLDIEGSIGTITSNYVQRGRRSGYASGSGCYSQMLRRPLLTVRLCPGETGWMTGMIRPAVDVAPDPSAAAMHRTADSRKVLS